MQGVEREVQTWAMRGRGAGPQARGAARAGRAGGSGGAGPPSPSPSGLRSRLGV